MQRYTPTQRNIKLLGRTQQMADSIWLAFSGAGGEFAFNGRRCEISLLGDSTATLEQTENHARIAIYADGIRAVDALMDAPEKTFTVVNDDAAAEHVIRIVKLSETAMSTCGIAAIAADGEIRPTGSNRHLVEFIGDSITCGYGVDEENPEQHFLTGTEDVTRAYAWKTAQLLDSDYSMVSISGYGIISGYTATAEEPVTAQLLPDYYEKLGFSYGTYQGQQPQNIPWNFAARQPDVIVINLGTNDDSYCQDDLARQQHYCCAYAEFLKAVRRSNPGARILCTLGMMGDRLYPFVEQAAADYTAQTGDENIACMAFEPQLEEDGRAADYHPSETTHQKAAEKLAAHIREMMHW